MRIVGLDVTSRGRFALAIVVFLSITDLGVVLMDRNYLAWHWRDELMVLVLAGMVRFGLTYKLVWPLAVHATHRQAREWIDGVLLSLVIVTTCFMTSWVSAVSQWVSP